jgi:hypothetical protein
MGDGLTHGSAWALIRDVAAFAKRFAEQGGHPQPIREAIVGLSSAGLSSVIWRAPSLRCEIRPSKLPPPSVLLLTFRQEPPKTEDAMELHRLTLQLPVLEPPLREADDDDATWQEASRAHEQTWRDWILTHPDDPAGAYHCAYERWVQLKAVLDEERQACRSVTVHVGLDGRPQRLPPRHMKARRQVETWRFKLERRSPLEEALANRKPIDRLMEQGKRAEAAALEASRERLIAGMDAWPEPVKRRWRERLAWGWRSLWIDPSLPSDDIVCQLVLYLCQERLLDPELTPDVSTFLKTYMGQFKYAVTQDERELLHERYQLEWGGTGFHSLLRTYAEPESSKTLRLYIAKTFHGLQASEARKHAKALQREVLLPPEDAEEAQLQARQGRPSKPRQPFFLPHESEGRQFYSVDELRGILEAESDADAWVPDRATLYRWIDAEKIPVTPGAQGRKCLDAEGVERVRALVRERRNWKALKDYWIEVGTQRGSKNPKAAAVKRRQRSRQSGKGVEDLVRTIIEGTREVREQP